MGVTVPEAGVPGATGTAEADAPGPPRAVGAAAPGGTGAGLGVASVPLMSLVMSPVQAAGILLPILCLMDLISLWALPLAGLLLIAGQDAWAYLGLVGGGVYVYFGGRGILTRLELQRRGFRIGDPGDVRLGLVMLGVWGLAGLITIVAAIAALA